MNNKLEDRLKIYVPDTNVLINDPFAVFILSGNIVPSELVKKHYSSTSDLYENKTAGAPNNICVLEIVEKELDNLKTNTRKSPFTIHSVLRALDVLSYLREYGKKRDENIKTGITLSNGAIVWKDVHDEINFQKNNIYDANNDDRILFGIKRILQANKKNNMDVIFVSQDGNARSRAIDIGIATQKYYEEEISEETIYSGNLPIKVSSEELSGLQKRSILKKTKFQQYGVPPNIFKNQFVMFYASSTNSRLFISDGPNKPLRKLTHFDEFMESIKKPVNDDEKNDIMNKYTRENIKELIIDSSLKKKSKRSFLKRLKQLNSRNAAEFLEELMTDISPNSELPKLRKYVETGGDFEFFDTGKISLEYNTQIVPKSLQPAYIELLMDPNIGAVSVIGEQGSGKTYFAMHCGLEQVKQGRYDKIRYMTPLVTMDDTLGFLPGNLEAKMAPWMEAFRDNLFEIYNYYDIEDVKKREQVKKQIEKMKDELYVFDVATYIKGRTFRKEFVIVDEAHFFTKDQMRILLGRIGKSSKIVFIGDPKQIAAGQTKYITERTSGLVHLVSKLSGKALYGHITMPEQFTIRSEVSNLANYL